MGTTAAETFQLIKQVTSVSHTWVFEWYVRFWDYSENIKDDKHGMTNSRCST
jgi:hypothetical protein